MASTLIATNACRRGKSSSVGRSHGQQLVRIVLRADCSAAAIWLKLFGLHRLDVPLPPDTTDRGLVVAKLLRKLIDKERS
jgi:hypothetical protein